MSFLDAVNTAMQSDQQSSNQNAGGGEHNIDLSNNLLALLGGQQTKTEEPSPEDELRQLLTPGEKDFKEEVFDPNAIFSDIKPEDVAAEINKANFVGDLFTPEVTEAIIGGGQEAVKALATVMNQVAQKVSLGSFQMGSRMVSTGLAKAAPAWNNATTSQLRSTNVMSAIQEADPLFTHPMADGMAIKLRDAIIAKNPNATKEEVISIAKKAISSFRGPATTEQQKPKEEAPTDWEKFFAG